MSSVTLVELWSCGGIEEEVAVKGAERINVTPLEPTSVIPDAWIY